MPKHRSGNIVIGLRLFFFTISFANSWIWLSNFSKLISPKTKSSQKFCLKKHTASTSTDGSASLIFPFPNLHAMSPVKEDVFSLLIKKKIIKIISFILITKKFIFIKSMLI